MNLTRVFAMNRAAQFFALIVFMVSMETALADSRKKITRTFDAAMLEKLELDISVVELDIEIHDGNDIELEINLEAQRRFFGLRPGSVDDIELEEERHGSNLLLRIDEQNVEQNWTMRIPAKLALVIDVGVGEVVVDKLSNELVMNIGVGSVHIDALEESFDEIHLKTGVGDAVIRGMQSRADNERDFISADAYYKGTGVHDITIDVGVGEVLVRKE
jgi:uncharacterized membrane protein YkoI